MAMLNNQMVYIYIDIYIYMGKTVKIDELGISHRFSRSWLHIPNRPTGQKSER